MNSQPMSQVVAGRLQSAAQILGTADPLPYVQPLLERTFSLPAGDAKYATNTLTPGAAPVEPSFSEREPESLRFTIEPLGPDAPPTSRRDEATREMRRLVGRRFGPQALNWFDERSEEWRGLGSRSRLNYGAFFGSAYDKNGLKSSKVYYEMNPQQIDALPAGLSNIVRNATHMMPSLYPLFTTISCQRDHGQQRATFLYRGPLKLAELHALCERFGLAHRLPSLLRVFGLALGGRFELPPNSTVVALGNSNDGPELKVEVMLGMLPDLPSSFFDLLALGLSERPRELKALSRWLRAFTEEDNDWPGNPSVLSVRITPKRSATVTLYLRPVEFEIKQHLKSQTNGMP